MSRSQPIKLSDAKVEELKRLASPAEQAEEAAKAERREYMKQAQRLSRERKAIKAVAELAETREQWRTEMRKALPNELREKYAALEAEVESQMCWMEHGWKMALLDPSDPEYLSAKDGLADLNDFIAECGTIHDAFTYDSFFLSHEVQPLWAVWQDERLRDAPSSIIPVQWRKPYWQDNRLDALTTEEGEPTKIVALYGIEISLSDFHVLRWKQRVKEHPHHHEANDVERCWLCKFEAHKIATPTAL